MTERIRKVDALVGVPTLPADKSIAHRSAMLASISDGVSRIVNYPNSADPQSTLACMRQLGVEITFEEGDEDDAGIMVVNGVGLRGLKKPDGPLDCGNSGTTMRLLAGILAGQDFESEMIGDASLSSRPMKRIIDPLTLMGAQIESNDGRAPLRIRGGKLKGHQFDQATGSAQVKSAILLAGLYADGDTVVTEDAPSRDHTERMLGLSALDLGGKRLITMSPGRGIRPRTWTVPADFSAAAFFIVAGTIIEHARVIIMGVGLNPTRAGLLDVLSAMGSSVSISNERDRGGETIGDLEIRGSRLSGLTIDGNIIPNIIDEIPILAVAATQAEGRTVVRGAADLRNKECDRIDAIVKNLRALGANIEEFEDGFAVTGPTPLKGTNVDSFDDHRIAMAMGVAGLVAEGETVVEGSKCVEISFPGYWEELGKMMISRE